MSKGPRQVLPSQKGTELWPKITQQPAKLTVKGVPPETPLYHAVANTYAGRLKAFHAKAQQAYALSGSEVVKQRFDWGDGARATYTNMQGQEILELEVSIEIIVAITELLKTEAKPVYDWAVIDLHVPLFRHEYFNFGDPGSQESAVPIFIARMHAPAPKVPPVANGEVSVIGEAGNRSQGSLDTDSPLYQFNEFMYSGEKLTSTPQPLLQWALAETRPKIEVRAGGGEFVESLLIDVRNFHIFDDVVVDLFAGFAKMSDDVTFVILEKTSYWVIQRPSTPDDLEIGGIPTVSTRSFPSPGVSYYNNSREPADNVDRGGTIPNHGGGFDIPPPTNPFFDPFWGDVYVGGVVIAPIPQGEDLSDGYFHENVLHYEFYPKHNYDTPPLSIVPSASARIEFAMFMGTPDWVSSQNDISDPDEILYYGQWEHRGLYPGRFSTATIGVFDMPLRKEPPDDPAEYDGGTHGLKLVGRLHILPKLGSVTFEPST